MSIIEIAQATEGRAYNLKDVNVGGVVIDSRLAKTRDVFVAIKGERTDGHNFLDDIYNKGVSACIVSQAVDYDKYPNMVIIEVNDTIRAIQDLAKYYRNKFDIKVIGVTGSTGKTSTKEMIWSVLSERYKVLKNLGNFNNELGLPLTIFNLDCSHQLAVLEIGMSDLGEIEKLSEIARPDIAVITNIGLSHIENLKTQENILKAKMEIATFFNEKNTLVVNGDDKFLSKITTNDYEVIKCSIMNNKETFTAINMTSLGENGVEFDLVINNQQKRVQIPQPGLHNVSNSLLAAAVATKLGLSMEEIVQGLSKSGSAQMRMDIINGINNSTIINDCYNASPDSMKAGLQVLKDIAKNKRTIAILGDMYELGEMSEQSHREIGFVANKVKIDIIIAVGQDAKFIYQETLNSSDIKGYYFPSKEQALPFIKQLISKEDVILVKGSRGMKMEKITEEIKEGSKQ